MRQYVVDVIGDLLDFVPRVTVDDEHDVVTDIPEGSEPVQQIPDRTLGVVDLVGKLVDGSGQLVALLADNRCRRTYFVQGVIDLVAFGQVLGVQQRLRPVQGPLNPASGRGEVAPTGCGRMQTR